MGRLNKIEVMGKIKKIKKPTVLGKEEMRSSNNDEQSEIVLNLIVQCYDEETKKYYNLPVAVWGEKAIQLTREFAKNRLSVGDLIYVNGELRYSYIYNKDEKGKVMLDSPKLIYITIKANTVEFVSREMKKTTLNTSINEVRLFGNLVEDPVETEEGFVVAVDRLYSKEMKLPNYKTTDYITLVMDKKEKMKGNLKKGDFVIVDGKLLTRKQEGEQVRPTIVVGVNKIVGGE